MIRDAVTGLLDGGEPKVVSECRRCGTSVEPDAEECPHCGPDVDLVRYEIE